MEMSIGFWSNRGGWGSPLNTDKVTDAWFYYDRKGRSGVGMLAQTRNRHYGIRLMWRD